MEMRFLARDPYDSLSSQKRHSVKRASIRGIRISKCDIGLATDQVLVLILKVSRTGTYLLEPLIHRYQ